MIKEQFQKATPITPNFPNWEKSFISGPNRPICDVEHRLSSDPIHLITHVKFKGQAEGPPGHIHGGASAGIIDEVMGILVWSQKYPCVTQTLNLKYLKLLPIDIETYLVTTITSVTEKTIQVNCIIVDHKKTPYVQAEGVFHRLKQEQLNKLSIHLQKRS